MSTGPATSTEHDSIYLKKKTFTPAPNPTQNVYKASP
jgi:hypothetical protein